MNHFCWHAVLAFFSGEEYEHYLKNKCSVARWHVYGYVVPDTVAMFKREAISLQYHGAPYGDPVLLSLQLLLTRSACPFKWNASCSIFAVWVSPDQLTFGARTGGKQFIYDLSGLALSREKTTVSYSMSYEKIVMSYVPWRVVTCMFPLMGKSRKLKAKSRVQHVLWKKLLQSSGF